MLLKNAVRRSIEIGSPILGVGPMSQFTVDAAVQVVEKHDVPMFLIASRRQVDSLAMGGGYVNGWSTETFSEYVRKSSKSENFFVCRDHGGPWQNPKELVANRDYASALNSAMNSFKIDIDSGFDLIHIDPIYDNDGSCVSSDVALSRAVEIQAELHAYARSQNKIVEFEFGTEDQSELPSVDLAETKNYLETLVSNLKKRSLPKPVFTVFQTGTKVMERGNCGAFPNQTGSIRKYVSKFKVSESINLIRSFGIEVKEHNGDFLSDDALCWRKNSGIGGLNVAPEFGQIETQTYLNLMEQCNLSHLKLRFEEMADESGKWKKWTRDADRLSLVDRTVIAGHYLFASPQFRDIRDELDFETKARSINLDATVVKNIASSIERYLHLLGWSLNH